MKTRIRVEKSEYKTVYIPEYYVDGWIFKGWESFFDLDSSCAAIKAYCSAANTSKSKPGDEQFAKDVIDAYHVAATKEQLEKYHHKHKEISYVKYP